MKKKLIISMLLLISFMLHASQDPKENSDSNSDSENVVVRPPVSRLQLDFYYPESYRSDHPQQNHSSISLNQAETRLFRNIARNVDAALRGACIAHAQEEGATTQPQEAERVARLLRRPRNEQLDFFRQQFIQQHPQATQQETEEHLNQMAQNIPEQTTNYLRQQINRRQSPPPAT